MVVEQHTRGRGRIHHHTTHIASGWVEEERKRRRGWTGGATTNLYSLSDSEEKLLSANTWWIFKWSDQQIIKREEFWIPITERAEWIREETHWGQNRKFMKIILKTNIVIFVDSKQNKEEFKHSRWKWRKAPKREWIQWIRFFKDRDRMCREAYCAHYCKEESEEEPHWTDILTNWMHLHQNHSSEPWNNTENEKRENQQQKRNWKEVKVQNDKRSKVRVHIQRQIQSQSVHRRREKNWSYSKCQRVHTTSTTNDGWSIWEHATKLEFEWTLHYNVYVSSCLYRESGTDPFQFISFWVNRLRVNVVFKDNTKWSKSYKQRSKDKRNVKGTRSECSVFIDSHQISFFQSGFLWFDIFCGTEPLSIIYISSLVTGVTGLQA